MMWHYDPRFDDYPLELHGDHYLAHPGGPPAEVDADDISTSIGEGNTPDDTSEEGCCFCSTVCCILSLLAVLTLTSISVAVFLLFPPVSDDLDPEVEPGEAAATISTTVPTVVTVDTWSRSPSGPTNSAPLARATMPPVKSEEQTIRTIAPPEKVTAVDSRTETPATSPTTMPATTESKRMNTSVPSKTVSPTTEHPLLCTVSDKFSASVKLPADGVCTYVFFDSLYKQASNSLTTPNAMTTNAKEFLRWPLKFQTTQFGMSISLEHGGVKNEYQTPSFDDGLDALWLQGITHYGMLNFYGDYATGRYLLTSKALSVLKKIHSHLQHKETPTRKPKTAIGITPYAKQFGQILGRLRKEYEPDIFIALAHISYSDNDRVDCRILPPTVAKFPFSPTYGHTVRDATKMLRYIVSKISLKFLALAFTLQGRFYQPSEPDLGYSQSSNFDVFKPCQKTYSTQFVVPASVCSISGSALPKNYKYSDSLNASWTFDKKTPQTMTFDSDEALRFKICTTKRDLRNVPYGIAAYDIDYDTWPTSCPLLRLHKPFSRLDLLKKLNDYVYVVYERQPPRSVCEAITAL